VDELARRIDIAEEDIGDGVTRRLAKRPTIEDTGNILMSGPLVEEAGADGIDNNDGVVTVVSNGVDKAVWCIRSCIV
jgi:hypothetical protein